MTDLRTAWECAGECGLRTRYMDGAEHPEPSGWEHGYCVGCLGEIEEPEDHARRLLRTGMKQMFISTRCPKVSAKRVSEIREEMVAAGELAATQYEKRQGDDDDEDEPPEG